MSTGNLKPESILAREVGYLLDKPQFGLGLDVRVFHEKIGNPVEQLNDNTVPATKIKDYANVDDFSIKGMEYQLKWRPWQGAELGFNQAFIEINSTDPGNVYAAPKRASTLVFFQKLPHGLDLTLSHQNSSKVKPQGASVGAELAMKRTDVRVSTPLWMGRHRGELAVVVQNVGAAYQDLEPNFFFKRRAFVTLTFEN